MIYNKWKNLLEKTLTSQSSTSHSSYSDFVQLHQKKKTKKTPKKTKYVMTLSSPRAERLLVLRKKLGVPFKNRLLSTNSKHSVLGKSQKDG